MNELIDRLDRIEQKLDALLSALSEFEEDEAEAEPLADLDGNVVPVHSDGSDTL